MLMTFDTQPIRKQVEKVIEYSQEVNGDIDCSALIASWVDGKSRFLPLFGDSLIYECPDKISIKLPLEEKNKQIEQFYDTIRFHWDGNNFDYYGLKELLIRNEAYLYENKVVYPYEKALEGMKISKAMKFFVEDKELLDAFQTALSRMIQEEKITGTLCLSIHPLDYLSVSENTNNWRSCHALDGDYRAGNLAYMVDESTIVCYLKTSNDLEKLPHFPPSVPWNSKKWRMLLFVSEKDNGLFAGRHYPFFSEPLMNECKTMMIRLLPHTEGWDEWSNWHKDSIKRTNFESGDRDDYSFDERIFMNGTILKKKSIMTSSPDDLHYNDLLKSTCYTPYYAWRTWPKVKGMFFTIGNKPVPCPKCGKGIVKTTDAMICNDCLEYDEDHCTCHECGDVIRTDDAYYIDNGGFFVCESCFYEYYGYCSQCEESYSLDDLIYDENDSCYYCPDCYQEIIENRGGN